MNFWEFPPSGVSVSYHNAIWDGQKCLGEHINVVHRWMRSKMDSEKWNYKYGVKINKLGFFIMIERWFDFIFRVVGLRHVQFFRPFSLKVLHKQTVFVVFVPFEIVLLLFTFDMSSFFINWPIVWDPTLTNSLDRQMLLQYQKLIILMLEVVTISWLFCNIW